MNDDAMQFAADFIKYVDKVGIYDEFDKTTNKMKTSEGVEGLYKQARELIPDLPVGVPAQMMRDLTEDETDASIDGNNKVIDMRQEFRRKMSANSGAQGLLQQLGAAAARGDTQEIKRITELAKTYDSEVNRETD